MVSSGPINTPIWDTRPAPAGVPREAMLQPDDIADTILWLIERRDGIRIDEVLMRPSRLERLAAVRRRPHRPSGRHRAAPTWTRPNRAVPSCRELRVAAPFADVVDAAPRGFIQSFTTRARRAIPRGRVPATAGSRN